MILILCECRPRYARTNSRLTVGFRLFGRVDGNLCADLPLVAYKYLGLAIRTCLAAGYNRETPDVKTDQHYWVSRAWW